MQMNRQVQIAATIGLLLSIGQMNLPAQSLRRAKTPITVGPTVQISREFPGLSHGENLSVGDPIHAGRLITCSMVRLGSGFNELGRFTDQFCYVSFDGGKTWESTLQVTDKHLSGDPAVVYGPGEDVYAVSLSSYIVEETRKVGATTASRPHGEGQISVYKSTDGGRTWNKSSELEGWDRPFITVDRTDGKYAGRLYLVAHGGAPTIAGTGGFGVRMWRSTDGGLTFLGPVVANYPTGAGQVAVGTGAVLSDGTFVVVFALAKPAGDAARQHTGVDEPNTEIHIISSRDGGETFNTSRKIADVKLDHELVGGACPQLAADPGSSAFKDRLYAVYTAFDSGRFQIHSSYSSDQGKTWSKPIIVNDDRTPGKGEAGPDHILPAVAVNKNGVVLVTWYDRRDAKDDIGWRPRAAASLDGGETFSASVPITDAAQSATPWVVSTNDGSDITHSLVSLSLNVGKDGRNDTVGLAVDADGTFHPTWIDNHTGVQQLWTTSITVDGAAIRNGAGELSDLQDISNAVTLKLGKATFDRAQGTLTVEARLKNMSEGVVEGPLKVRVLTLESDLGVAEIANANNGQNGTGAVWDFSEQLSGPLGSMKLSSAKALTFRVGDLRALPPSREASAAGIVRLDAKIFGKLEKSSDQTHEVR